LIGLIRDSESEEGLADRTFAEVAIRFQDNEQRANWR